MRKNWRGSPKATSNWHLSILLKLVKTSKKDVFCDLGCGYGNLCIFARKKVGQAFGFETMPYRYHRANKNIIKSGLDNIQIFPKSYERPKSLNIIKKCNILYCSNFISLSFYKKLNIILKKNSWLIVYDLPPVPVKPIKKFDWYYIMKFPLQMSKNENDWIRGVTKNKFHKKSDLYRLIKNDLPDWKRRIKDLSKELKKF